MKESLNLNERQVNLKIIKFPSIHGERNLVLDEGGDQTYKITDRAGEVLFDLCNELNPPIKLRRGNFHGYDYNSRTVFAPVIQTERDIFTILHEACHISVFDDDPHLMISVEKYRSGEKIVEYNGNPVLAMERQVWARAAQLARTINKKTGVNLFSVFNSKKDYMAWIRATALRTYELAGNDNGIRLTKSNLVHTFLKSEWIHLTADERKIVKMWSKGKFGRYISNMVRSLLSRKK